MGVSKVAAGSVFCPTFCDFCKIKHPVSFRFGRGPQHTASPPRRRGRTAARTRKCHSDCQNAPRTQSWVSFVAIQHRSCRTPHNQRVRGKAFSVEKSRFFSGNNCSHHMEMLVTQWGWRLGPGHEFHHIFEYSNLTGDMSIVKNRNIKDIKETQAWRARQAPPGTPEIYFCA